MAKGKLQKFAAIKTFPNTFELDRSRSGKWNQSYFLNDHPITLELGCGHGQYTLELAQQYPGQNFIGVDIKGARIWRGAKTALELKLKNVAFLRTYIDHLREYFAPGEVQAIWLTFPDPYPKRRTARKRLTAPRFLEIYRQLLKADGLVHLKTDSQELFDYTLSVLPIVGATLLTRIDDLYAAPVPDEVLAIKTTYELKHLAVQRRIKYLCFYFGAA